METQEEIIARLEELLELPIDETMREATELKSAFYVLNHQKLDQQKLEHRELGAQMEDFIPIPNPLEDTFKELYSKYRDNKAKFIHVREEAEKKNLAEKKEVLKGLKELIDNEENIGKSFDRFKDFQDRWKKVGAVPKEKVAELSSDYKAEVDRFYYNININKELKEYDLAKNLEIRDSIVKKLEELSTAEIIKDIEFILAAAKEEWEEAGPVKPEVFQALRERYYEAVKVLHKKIQDFYSERKSEMETNLDAKKAMVVRVLEMAETDSNSISKWNKLTEEVNKLREDWKLIGQVERKHHHAVWEEFKEALDKFFEKKKGLLGEAREGFKENKEAKEKLIARAEQLKDSTEWREAGDKFKRLQNDWKRVGSAGPRDENKLWSKFRGVCDEFFNRKKEWFDSKDDREAACLKSKEELLAKMANTKLEGSKEEGLEAIKLLAAEWAAIDHVPKKDVNRIATEYDNAIQKLYAQLKMDKGQVEKVRFKNKVERMAVGDNGVDQIQRERHYVQKMLREKKDELMKYENNMAFFANAKPDNPLLVSAQKSIELLRAEVASFEEKLKLLNVSERKLA
ncbi:MAG: DUF349 domain-containing protein [Flavobacteriales bacterium]|nr:DUF349 domain-containing protein [Flavobacteriales bacterium]